MSYRNISISVEYDLVGYMFDTELNQNKIKNKFIKSNKVGASNMAYFVEKIIEIVKSEPKIGEWIPVEERLPKQREPVLVTYINVFNEFLCDDCAMINENGNWIWCFDESLVELQIIAWQPLPKPYEVRENERP